MTRAPCAEPGFIKTGRYSASGVAPGWPWVRVERTTRTHHEGRTDPHLMQLGDMLAIPRIGQFARSRGRSGYCRSDPVPYCGVQQLRDEGT